MNKAQYIRVIDIMLYQYNNCLLKIDKIFYFICLSVSCISCIMIDIGVAKDYIYSFEEKVNLSDIIVVGEVSKIKKNFLGRDIALTDLILKIKGNTEAVQFKIGIGKYTKLTVSEKYILFLKKDNSSFKLVGDYQGYYHIRKDGLAYYGGDNINLEDLIMNINEIMQKK